MFSCILLGLIHVNSATSENQCTCSTTDATATHENEHAPPEDKELVLTFVLNRHGERTPDKDELSLSNVKRQLQKYVDKYGYEGLTDVGRNRVHNLGKFIRQRYGPNGLKLLSDTYRCTDLYLRSTDKERTKITANTVMSAVYNPGQPWNVSVEEISQPVPVNVVPLSEDYLRFYTNCQKYLPLMVKAKEESIHDELAPFSDLVGLIKKHTGKDFNENPTMFQTLFDLFRSQAALGLAVPQWAQPIMPRLHEAARLAYHLYFRTDEMKKIAGGVVLNDFVQKAQAIASGDCVPQPFHMYSCHDFNLGALIEVTKVQERNEIFPEYASLFGLEMYRDKTDGKYYVLPIFLEQADEKNVHRKLHFEFNTEDNYCELTKFLENTQEFLMTEEDYYKTCNIKTQ